MNRRAFIAIVSVAVSWPLSAQAQQAAKPVIGFLNGASPSGYAPYVAGFPRSRCARSERRHRRRAAQNRDEIAPASRVPSLPLRREPSCADIEAILTGRAKPGVQNLTAPDDAQVRTTIVLPGECLSWVMSGGRGYVRDMSA